MKKVWKWKVSPAPTGPYKSFHSRAWPELWSNIGDEDFLLADIVCEECAYTPAASRRTDLDLIVRLYSYEEGRFKRKTLRLKRHFNNLPEAKKFAELALEKNAKFLPPLNLWSRK